MLFSLFLVSMTKKVRFNGRSSSGHTMVHVGLYIELLQVLVHKRALFSYLYMLALLLGD
jgi:hypothetical protein